MQKGKCACFLLGFREWPTCFFVCFTRVTPRRIPLRTSEPWAYFSGWVLVSWHRRSVYTKALYFTMEYGRFPVRKGRCCVLC